MIVSRHYLRRRARQKARSLEATWGHDYTVTKAKRGPHRWYVLRKP